MHKARYDRRVHLPRVVLVPDNVLNDFSIEGRGRLIGLLIKTARKESQQRSVLNFAYCFGRHAQLVRCLHNEVDELRAIQDKIAARKAEREYA